MKNPEQVRDLIILVDHSVVPHSLFLIGRTIEAGETATYGICKVVVNASVKNNQPRPLLVQLLDDHLQTTSNEIGILIVC